MDICICMAGWIPLLFTWNYHNIVNQLYSNIKEKVFFLKRIKITLLNLLYLKCLLHANGNVKVDSWLYIYSAQEGKVESQTFCLVPPGTSSVRSFLLQEEILISGRCLYLVSRSREVRSSPDMIEPLRAAWARDDLQAYMWVLQFQFSLFRELQLFSF